MRLKRAIAFHLAAAALLAPFAPVRAEIFDPHLIISDAEIRNYGSMSYSEVRSFLSQKGGMAETFDVDPYDGLLKSAPELVFDAANRYKVNPKYILVQLQKESSAVETARPNQSQLDWAAGYALCDGCWKTAALAQKYKGLGKQIDATAGWLDWFFAEEANRQGLKHPGTPTVISGISVTPANMATAALYSYTPHLHGNRLFWSIWTKWFTGYSIGFPDGSLVRNEKTGAVALIQGGKFRPILSRAVLLSRFNEKQAIAVNHYDFAAMQERRPGSPVKFADYSLVRTEDGATFLLTGSKKRRIISPNVFAKIGFNPEEVEDATAADVADYAEGEPITLSSSVPSGVLKQDSATGGVYYVEDGTKRPIWDRTILTSSFPGRPIVPATPTALAALATGSPVKFADGALIKSKDSPAVYVVSGGKKRFISSESVFNGFGYDWNAIMTVSSKAFALMETGDPL